jgi:hypothetical protein
MNEYSLAKRRSLYQIYQSIVAAIVSLNILACDHLRQKFRENLLRVEGIF